MRCDWSVKITLTCGGQTSRCINDRAREHELSIKNKLRAHLPMHCESCKCEPDLFSIRVLKASKDTLAHELMEAYNINVKDVCISDAPVSLRRTELQFF